MTTSVVDNGVNVEALLGAREAFADAPEIAQFQWRSTVSWVNGTHSRSEVETFFGFGEEQRHGTRRADHEPEQRHDEEEQGQHDGEELGGQQGRGPGLLLEVRVVPGPEVLLREV